MKKPKSKPLKSKALKKSDLKTSESKVLKCSKPKAKIYSRHQNFKPKVLNDPKPYYMKDKVQNKKKYVKTNPKGPLRLWVPKSEIVFATNMLQRRSKTLILVPGQWMITTYDRIKAYISNPNSKRGRNCGVWRKP